MSRHNRRRTRGGHLQKNMNNTTTINNTITNTNNMGQTYPFPHYLPPPNSNLQFHTSTRLPPGLSLPLWKPAFSPSLPPSSTSFSSLSAKPVPLRPVSSSRTGISARHWHNRYMAWQAREKRQREESARLQAEKMRIFGRSCGDDDLVRSDSGDDMDAIEDEELCEKMLEYFGGLDFIEW